MITTLVTILILTLVAGIVFLSKGPSDTQVTRKKYLEDLAHYVSGQLSPSEQYENAYKIEFSYEGRNYVFEDIKDEGLKDMIYSKGLLRVKTPFDLIINFMEVQRTTLMAKSNTTKGVNVPKKLNQFAIFTNMPDKTNQLFHDEEIVKIFAKYKNIDKRGHPIMSLEINGNYVVLKFHPAGQELKPNLLDLQFKVPSIGQHLDCMTTVLKKMELIKPSTTT